MTPHLNTGETSDLLYGVAAIATYLRMTERQARHRAGEGSLPTFKIGRNVCARRSGLDRWLADQEAAANAARKEGR